MCGSPARLTWRDNNRQPSSLFRFHCAQSPGSGSQTAAERHTDTGYCSYCAGSQHNDIESEEENRGVVRFLQGFCDSQGGADVLHASSVPDPPPSVLPAHVSPSRRHAGRHVALSSPFQSWADRWTTGHSSASAARPASTLHWKRRHAGSSASSRRVVSALRPTCAPLPTASPPRRPRPSTTPHHRHRGNARALDPARAVRRPGARVAPPFPAVAPAGAALACARPALHVRARRGALGATPTRH